MKTQFNQPQGSTSRETNKEAIARIFGIPYGRGEYVAVPAGDLTDDGGFICVPTGGGPLVWKLVVVTILCRLSRSVACLTPHVL